MKKILFAIFSPFSFLLLCFLFFQGNILAVDDTKNNLSLAFHPSSDTLKNPYIISGKLLDKEIKKKSKARYHNFTIIAYKVTRDKNNQISHLKIQLKKHKQLIQENGEFELELYGNHEYFITCLKEGYSSIPVFMPKRNVAKGQHISIEIPIEKSENVVVKGNVVTEANGSAINEAQVTIEEIETGIKRVITTESDGAFAFSILKKQPYLIHAYKKGFFYNPSDTITSFSPGEWSLNKNIQLQEIVVGQAIRVKGFYFNINDTTLTDSQKEVLDNLLNIIIDNPGIHFELSCHSDSRGNDDYNLELTQNRAEEAVRYLVEKGEIEVERLTAVGYGEKFLVNGCKNGIRCSSKKHEENRRMELKVMKIVE
ncbi:OmpA family protein [Flexithrix dorotheae]|uniref:OmpA family protein n=1 Tax=Flexithrix dorotheae TaxID=70993 RepID=UPI000380F705|nr:OmpA family protein [Flexithrix dorotheae]